MANAILSGYSLKEKQTGYRDYIGDIIHLEDDVVTTIEMNTESNISNTLKIGGINLDEAISNIDAVKTNGITSSEILNQKRFGDIRLMVNTTDNSAVGERYNFIVTEDEEIFLIGRNPSNYFVNGQADDILGLHSIRNPKQGISKIKEILTVYWSVYVLYEDGDLYVMGENNNGQLGIGNLSIQYALTFSADNVVKVSTSGVGIDGSVISVLILKNDGTVWACGYNNFGQLGIGSTTTNENIWRQSLIPMSVGTPIDILMSGTRISSAFIITDTGKLLVTGYNGYGQLGDGTTVNKSSFSKVLALDTEIVTEITSNEGISVLCLTQSGKVFSWGYNGHGELGDGTTVNKTLPKEVTTIPAPYNSVSNPIVKLVGGKSHYGMYGLLSQNGDLFTVGYNGYGQIGDGTTVNKSSFVFVLGNVKYVEVATSSIYSYHRTLWALTNNNILYSWGYNGEGQCGQNHTTNVLLPTKVNFEYSGDIKQITMLGYSSAVTVYILLNDGRIYACGDNDYQQVSKNTSATINRLVYTFQGE